MMKRTIPMLLAMAAGIVMILAYFFPLLAPLQDKTTVWFNILAAVAFILGGGNLLKVHLKKVSDRREGWAYSMITLAAFVSVLAIGLFKLGVNPLDEFPTQRMAGDFRAEGSGFWYVYEYVFAPLTATIFSMLAFYVASAAFRAFRAKNLEAILLLGTAFVILLGRTAAGVFLTDFLPEEGMLANFRLENLTVWIMNNPVTAGNRAIMIGIALGTASVSLKILLGVDRSYLGGGD